MVLGITRSRFHAPLQSLGVVLSLAGNYLGHHHAGREFHTTAHSHFAAYLWWYLVSQTCLGIFLKLHVLEGSVARRVVVKVHGIVGKSFPVFGWTQMIFGCVPFLFLVVPGRLGCVALSAQLLTCLGLVFPAAASQHSASALASTSGSARRTSSWVSPTFPSLLPTFSRSPHAFVQPVRGSHSHRCERTSLCMLTGGMLTLGLVLAGSAFIAYGVILVLMMRLGAGFLLRRNMSQEYMDSWVLMIWGASSRLALLSDGRRGAERAH